MKLMISTFICTVALLSPASADWRDDVFTDLNRTAPRSAFVDTNVVSANIFDQLRDTAPVKAPDIGNDALAGE